MITKFKKIFFYILNFIILILLFINADSITGATEPIETTTTMAIITKTTTSTIVTTTTTTTIEKKQQKNDVDSITGATDIIETTTTSIESTTSTTTSTTTTIAYDTKDKNIQPYQENQKTPKKNVKIVKIGEDDYEKRQEKVIETKKEEKQDVDAITMASEIIEEKQEQKIKPKKEDKEEKLIEPNKEQYVKIPENKIKIVKIAEDYELTKVKKKDIVKKQKTKDTSNDEQIEEFIVKNPNDKKTNMIIFENSKEDIPPFLGYELEEEQVIENRYYELENFNPKTVDDFFLAKPKLTYDKNSIIIKSKIFISPEIGEQIFNKSYNLFKNGQIKNSKLIFLKLIYYNYRIFDSFYHISLCLYLEKDYKNAIEYLNYLISISQTDNANKISLYYFQIATIYYEQEDYNNAIRNYNLSLNKDSNFSRNYNGLGLSYYKLGNVEKALENWKKGMELGNKDSEYNYNWLIKKIK
ncbi:MAG: hypothetical protein A2086_02295 [Spirochaetes bacterium GWD1_27_9]|nr:MAG: hypothetical protein A2Z98_17525 [Spirochaetes bacterium GWB1_27_13]OHD25554.1 MAG: hypothetical protein A2Y34_06975 [Spirochaetes bacterium GWC1_27_15]OHD30407.1 MAG: hypothetical protein A2086_02295 [Spirochaetes bacterium GWD1_27_9]